MMVDDIESVVPAWTPLGFAVDALTTSSEELAISIDGERVSIAAATAATRENTEVTAAAIVAKNERAKATDRAAEAERAGATAAKEAADAIDDAQKRREKSAKALEDASMADAEAYRAAAKEEQALADARAQHDEEAASDLQDWTDAWTAAIDEINAKRKESNQQFVDGAFQAAGNVIESIGMIGDYMAEQAGAALDRTQSQIEDLQDLLDGLSVATVDAATLSGDALVEAYESGAVAAEDLSDAQRAAIEAQLQAEFDAAQSQAKIEKAAVKDAWKVQQAAAYAGTTVAGIEAGIMAFAQLGPVAGAIAAASIAALTATHLGIISKTEPQYHAGGVSMYPDEQSSRTLEGEGWLNRQAVNAAGGPQGVAAMNAGQDFIGKDLCDHYAIRQGALDWQIWITSGKQPLPRKIVITNRTDEARPQSVSVITWNLKPTFNDTIFTYTPRAGSTKAEVIPVKTN
jgi:hypothetical protein